MTQTTIYDPYKDKNTHQQKHLHNSTKILKITQNQQRYEITK